MPNVSRRSFVELFTGVLASLPVLAGGVILAPRHAHANPDFTDDSELAGNESEYVIIDVVEPWEVGFQVVDVAKPSTNDAGLVSYQSVEGAVVTITSRFNGKVITSNPTDGNGFVNVDIRDLAVVNEGEDVNNLDSYYFNGTVTVEKENYRKFETALLAVEGGGGLQVPTHPSDTTGTPYPRLVSFDEWDALYSDNEFLTTPANTDEHTVDVSILDLPGDGAATIELWVDGETTPRQSTPAVMGERAQVGTRRVWAGLEPVYGNDFMGRVVTGYVDKYVDEPIYGTPANASLKALFLKTGDAACLPAGAKLKLVVTQNGTSYSWPLACTISEGVVEEPADKKNQKLNAINVSKTSTSGIGIVWPDSVPIIGGGNLSFWMPQLPIDIYVNPFGLVQITLKVPLWGYRNDKGNDEPSGWGRYPRSSVQSQWNQKVKTLKAMADKTNALVSKPGAVQQIDLFKSFSIDINFQLMALAKWDSAKGLFQGEVAGQIFASLNFTITENFFAGPIPVLITFALDASLIFGLSAGTYSTRKNADEKLIDAIFDFSRWHFDYANTGFTMSFNITPSLSVGVGIRGIASISVKGAITLSLFLGVPMGTQPKSLPSPHLTAGWSAQISLVIELFLFTQNFALYNKKFENFYDNWEGKNLAAEAEANAMSGLADLSFEHLLAELEPITDTMLAQTLEANVTAPTLSAQAENEAFVRDWSSAATEVEGQLEDGTPLRYVVYTWGEPKPDEDASAEKMPSTVAEGTPLPATGEDMPAEGTSEESETIADVTPPIATEGDETPEAVAEEPSSVDDGPTREDAVVTDEDPATREVIDVTADTNATADKGLEAQATNEASVSATWLTAMADTDLPNPGVSALGVRGGIRPSSDVRLFGQDDSHVFGDSRIKAVTVSNLKPLDHQSSTWTFRLASVSINDGSENRVRTRVIANCIHGSAKGTSHVIEFVTGIADMPHEDLYDYDFDVERIDQGDYSDLQLVIISGIRASEDTTLASAATDLVFTCMKLTHDELMYGGSALRPVNINTLSRKGNELIGGDTNAFHSIMSIQITRLGLSSESIVTFLDRSAATREEALGEGAQVSVGLLFVNWFPTCQIIAPQHEDFAKLIGEITDTTAYEQTLSYYREDASKHNWVYTLMLRGSESAHYILISIEKYVAIYTPEGAINVITSIKRCRDYDPSIRLVEYPGHDFFLTSFPDDPAQLDLPFDQRDYSKWTLHKVTWSNDPTPEMQTTPFGPSGFNVVNFAVNPEATYIFWPHTRDEYEDCVPNAQAKTDMVASEAIYQIMGCRIRDGHFSDPFVVADMDTDTDSLCVVDTNESAVVEMLRTEYVDTGERNAQDLPLYHAADIWYTAVPPVSCATATACEAPNPFVTPGGSIKFHVAVRNDGNAYLSGCSLTLCDYDEATDSFYRVDGATAQVVFGPDTIQESNYNRSDGNGGLTNLEPDYSLAPGKTSVYLCEVKTPKDWQPGEKMILFVASDGVVTGKSALSAQADGPEAVAESLDAQAIEFHIEPGEYKVFQSRTQHDQDLRQRHMDTLVVSQTGIAMDFSPAPTTESDEGEGNPSTGGTSGGAGGTASGTGGNVSSGGTSVGRSDLPHTADESPSGVLGAGLAALGAAALAYERRRAQNGAD